jgi:uncharacterized membrane protein YgcG
MRRLLQAARPDALALVLLVLAAVGVFVAGVQHGRLFHRGYAEVELVGPLFLMNAIGSMVVVLALVVDRIWLFCLGALSICLPSLVSIAISHSSVGFLGFREGGYDLDARVIVAAEIGAVVFALIGAAVAVRGRPRGGGATVLARAPLAALVVVAMGCAIVGIGTGSAPAADEPAPADAAVAASRERIAAAGAGARRGRELFADQGCDRCHAIAAIGAGGMLGPRLDSLDEDLDDNLQSIERPREDIADGYPEKLMPTDFGDRLGKADLGALATFVTAASGGARANGEEDGGGRGRGRGGSGDGRGRGGGGAEED